MTHAVLWLVSWPVSAACVVGEVTTASLGLGWTWPLRWGVRASAWRLREGQR